jgi:PAS domain S-box-containing protein
MLDLKGRIAFASTYFCDLVGIEPDKVSRMSYLDFVFAEDIQQATAILEHSKSPRPKRFRLRLRHASGLPVWVDVQGAALRTAAGEIYAISAAITVVRSAPS